MKVSQQTRYKFPALFSKQAQILPPLKRGPGGLSVLFTRVKEFLFFVTGKAVVAAFGDFV